MTFKKIVAQLHLWLGLTSGLVVFVIAVTGATYVFVDELKPVFYKSRLFVTPQATPHLPLSQLQQAAENALGNKPVTRVEIVNAPGRTYVFRALKLNKEGFSHCDYFQYYYRVYVNPYNGEIVKVEDTRNEFFQLVLSVHMRMLFGEKIGHYVVGSSVLIFVFMLISGIILWFPKKWNKAARDKSFRIKQNASFKRTNYDLHNVLGFYASVVLLVIALTGLVWVYDWMENSVRYVAEGGRKVAKLQPLISDMSQAGRGSAVDMAFSTTRSKSPLSYSYQINFPPKRDGTFNISAYARDWNKHDRLLYTYDQYSGKLLRSIPFAELNRGDQMYQLNFDLHTGSILGLPGKILVFCAGMICASLPVTGFMIWLGRRRKKKVHKEPVQVAY